MQVVTLEQLLALQEGLPLASQMDRVEREKAFSGVSVAIALHKPAVFTQAYTGTLPSRSPLQVKELSVRMQDDTWLFQGQVDVTPVVEAARSQAVWRADVRQMTIAQLLERYPDGFAVSHSGTVSQIVAATSHAHQLLNAYPIAPSNGGFLVVEMVD